MDIRPHNPQGGVTPGRPNSGSPRPRPVMSEFAPRRPSGPAPLAPRPAQPGQYPGTPAPTPVLKPTPSPAPTLSSVPRPQPQIGGPKPAHPNGLPQQHTPAPMPRPPVTPAQHQHQAVPLPTQSDKTPQPSERRNSTGHAGLVGMGVFLLLTVLFLSPLLPSKILDNFPGSSATSSTGDQTLACASDIQNASSITAYTSKLGSPLVYKYSSTITLHGTCDGKPQTAIGGHISQFNPLALVINLSIAALIAFAVAKVWAKIFSRKG